MKVFSALSSNHDKAESGQTFLNPKMLIFSISTCPTENTLFTAIIWDLFRFCCRSFQNKGLSSFEFLEQKFDSVPYYNYVWLHQGLAFSWLVLGLDLFFSVTFP